MYGVPRYICTIISSSVAKVQVSRNKIEEMTGQCFVYAPSMLYIHVVFALRGQEGGGAGQGPRLSIFCHFISLELLKSEDFRTFNI